MTEKKLYWSKTYKLNKIICKNLQYFIRKDTVLSPHNLTFLLIKSKKHYKAKFSINLILKKIYIILEVKKTHEEKRYSNWQCFVRKTTVLSPIKSIKIIFWKNH